MFILRLWRSVAVLGLFFLPFVTAAHHSRAGYDPETTELAGVLQSVTWRNPHFEFTLRAAGSEGAEESWAVEANSLYALQREGVTRDLFTVGERLRIAGHRSKLGDPAFHATNILLEDGREVLVASGVEPRWTNDYIGSRDLLAAELDRDAIRRQDRGFFRVWSAPRPSPQIKQASFTEAAVAARADWDMFDNFAIRCQQEGMPRIMTSPHPYEFVDHGDTISVRMELYDIERTVRMNPSTPPVNGSSSALGDSAGTWEGDTLVIRTANINWPYFDLIGTPLHEDVEVVERYSLSDDQSQLNYHFTITDARSFTQPATIEGHRLALGETIPVYDCQAN